MIKRRSKGRAKTKTAVGNQLRRSTMWSTECSMFWFMFMSKHGLSRLACFGCLLHTLLLLTHRVPKNQKQLSDTSCAQNENPIPSVGISTTSPCCTLTVSDVSDLLARSTEFSSCYIFCHYFNFDTFIFDFICLPICRWLSLVLTTDIFCKLGWFGVVWTMPYNKRGVATVHIT